MHRPPESAFETAIEEHLLTRAATRAATARRSTSSAGIVPGDFLAFIQETQPEEWAVPRSLQKDKAAETLLDDLCRALDSEHEGCLSVLRHGFKCFGKLFRVAYFAPASGMNPETQTLYAANRLTITRQLRYSHQARATRSTWCSASTASRSPPRS